MKKCLVFAFWIPPGMEGLGNYYLDLIEKYFNKEDVYIGINCGTEKNLIDKIKTKYKNSIIVPKDMCINSDTSGYQMALSILDKEYDYVVFGHSKGASYGTMEKSLQYRNYCEIFFWDKLEIMISFLEKNVDVGIIGTDYIFDHIGSPNYNNINKICDFPIKKPCSGFYANSFYMIKGNIIETLLKNINKDFFNKNLNDIDVGFNRYFFESHFPKISSMFGYRPSVFKNNEIKIL